MEKEILKLPNGTIKYVYDRFSIKYTSHAMERIWERKASSSYNLMFEAIKIVMERVVESKLSPQLHMQKQNKIVVHSPEGIAIVIGITGRFSVTVVTVWNEREHGIFRTKDPEYTCKITRGGLLFEKIITEENKNHDQKHLAM